jgi:hypothetical protein
MWSFRGKLVYDRTNKSPKLNCRNWECGVLIPVDMPKPEGRTLSGDDPIIAMPLPFEMAFEGKGGGVSIPVPMKIPGQRLVDTGKSPWFFAELANAMRV